MDHQDHLRSLFISSFNSGRGMLHTARAAIGAIPMIAKALLAKANKPIRIVVDPRTNTGSTDCESMIRLPVVPLPRDDDDIDGCIEVAATLIGLIHHEVGHCNHSDIADFRKARIGLERALVNIIEDVRMELMHIRDLPAARAYLDALNIVMAKRGLWCVPEGCNDPSTVFKAYVAFRINALYRNEPVSKSCLDEMRTIFVDVFTPDITQRLDELLEETPQLTDSRGSLELARKVIALIQDEQRNAEQEQSQDPQSSSEDQEQSESQDGDSGNEATKDADNDGQGESPESDSDADAKADATDGEGGNQDTTDADNDAQGDASDADSDADAKADADDSATGNTSDPQSDAEASADAHDDGQDSGSDADPDADAQADSDPGDSDADSDANSDAEASADADDNVQGSSGGTGGSPGQATADASGNTAPSDSTPSDGQPQPAGESQMPGTLNERLNSLLSTCNDTGSDRHDAANQMLQELVEQLAQSAYQSLNLEQAIADLNDDSLDGQESTRELCTDAHHDLDAAYSTASHIRRKMLSELDALTNADTFIGQRGSRLSSRHLHRVISGDSRVFKSVTDGIAPSTAVMLVQDVSSSMNGDPVRIASQALYASALALEGIDGIEVAAMAFPGNGRVIGFGESPRFNQDRFQLSAWGGTPMGEGIHVALNGLLAQPQERKLMIVLTDGEPANAPLALSMIATAEQHGIEVFGVGILTDSVQRLFSRWIRIDDIDQLPEQLVSLVRDEVLQSIAA